MRDITAKAKVNQGAITYHFGGKDGLYRAVLEAVRDQVGAQPLLDAAGVDRHPLDETVRLFLRQMLAPLAQGRGRDAICASSPGSSCGRRRFGASSRPRSRFRPSFWPSGSCVASARRPTTSTVAIATAWMMGQVITFVRDREYLAGPPFHLDLDAPRSTGWWIAWPVSVSVG